MGVPFLVVAIAVLLCAIAARRLLGAWWKYKGRRVVTCPENQRPAGVTVDARHAMATGLGKPPQLRLESCSRWPEKTGCGQECLSQIEASPEGCLVRNILLTWYSGKTCHSCGMPIGEVSLAGAKPAVLRADGVSVEWNEIPAEQLQETLLAANPICFACHTARKMLREHRELISGLSEATGRPAR
ncbi:MAG TPA: hypothetical protein VIN93_01895 [Bryobacteraceae bacterium]